MRRVRGFTIVQLGLALGILIAAGALLAGLHAWWSDYTSGLVEQGRAEIRAEWAADNATKVAALNKRILELVAQRDALEGKLATANTTIAAQARKEKERANTDASTTLADLDAGALVLRDGVVEVVSGCPAGRARSAAAALGAGAAGPACKPRYRLSKETEGRLVAIARDAELSSANLTGCLGIADSDRALINGAAP